jgi:hypothetical protein
MIPEFKYQKSIIFTIFFIHEYLDTEVALVLSASDMRSSYSLPSVHANSDDAKGSVP